MNDLIVIDPDHQVSDRLAKLEKLAETTKLVSNNRNSPNTLNGYASDWEDFEAWLININSNLCRPLPMS